MDFKSQYKHPLWQRKRLEVLNAANFSCENCFDSDEQLHVHHRHYVKGRMIWEYDNTELSVLCESCHARAHEVKDILGNIFLATELSASSALVGIVAAYCYTTKGICHVDTSSALAAIDDDHSYYIGAIAAQIANLYLGCEALMKILIDIKALTDCGSGGEIVISVPKIQGIAKPAEM